MPEPLPLNALQPGQQPRMTAAPVDQRPAVQVRIVTAQGERWAAGTAYGWTQLVVQVHWVDRDGYGRIDYFPAEDVERA